jgi:hypothetical protein
MAININHTNNTLSSNSGTFIFGTGIVPSIENAVYSSNFSGKYYGDGSALTGIATGSFLATGQYGLANEDRNLIIGGGVYSGCCNVALNNNAETYTAAANSCSNTIINSINASIEQNAKVNFIVGSYNSIISGGSCGNSILGGSSHSIKSNVYFSTILGGGQIQACYSNTAYANNFCAYAGKYYGDGSALTGIVGAGASTPQQTGILLTGATGFSQPHQAKNVGIIAQNCFFGQEGAGNSGYLLLDKGGVNETNNLFTVSPTTYCIGTFSAMLIGNGYVNGAATTTSMRIDGAYGGGIILNQVKNIYFKTQNSNDANVVIEDNAFRIAVSGVSGTMVWSSKIDLLDMNGYD